MKTGKQTVIFALTVLIVSYPGQAAMHRANSADELTNICRTISPGDSVILTEGTYTDQHFIFTGTGTKERPITLRAETPGKTILNGMSKLAIGGEYLVVDSLLFHGGHLKTGSIIEFCAKNSTLTQHCVLRNAAIIDYNPQKIDTRYFWVTLCGTGNIVEYCHFSGQTHSGVTVCVVLGDGGSAGHIIRRNYFGNRPQGNENGFETIRIGTSTRSMTKGRCIVTENLFEKCNGEVEIISNKSCENVYTRNTFLCSAGCLTLRHGNGCKVEGNIFIGGDAVNVGGVRVIGEGHQVSGNYFSGTKGRAEGAISLKAGIPDSPLWGFFQVKDCVVDNNTFVDNPGPLFALDAGYGTKGCKLLPKDVIISNNLMVVAKGAEPIIVHTNTPTGIVWKKNVVVGLELGSAETSGLELAPTVPESWKKRLSPQPLKRTDVGPGWMR